MEYVFDIDKWEVYAPYNLMWTTKPRKQRHKTKIWSSEMKLGIIDHNTYMGHVSIGPTLIWVPQILRQIVQMQEGFRVNPWKISFFGGHEVGWGGGGGEHPQEKTCPLQPFVVIGPLRLMLRNFINKIILVVNWRVLVGSCLCIFPPWVSMAKS